MNRLAIYCLVWAFVNFVGFTEKSVFVLLTLLIIVASGIEVFILFKKHGIKVLISPFVLCCLYLFAINFGISNFIYIVPAYEEFIINFLYNFFTSKPDFYYWMSQGLNHVFLGFLVMLLGYKIEERKLYLTRFTHFLFKSKKLLVTSYDIKLWKVLLLWSMSCIIKIYSIAQGIYGFTASSIALEENKGILQFLYYGTIVSKGALFFLSLLFFLKPKSISIKVSLIIVVIIELFFGLLSGFKSQIMFPFIIILFANIIVTGRIKLVWFVPIIFSVFLAYALVEPMRAASYGYQSDKKVDASELIELASTGIKEQAIDDENTLPFLYVFMSRNSLAAFVALSNKEASYTKKFYPQFDIQRKMLFSPILAYVPRAFWADKPVISNGGVIFNRELLGASDEDNVSIAISPFGYLLLGTHNSILYIIGFFFILGMLQYYIFHLYLSYGLGGLIVCLGMLVTLSIVEEPYTVLIAYFKDLPIFILFQFLFLCKFKRPAKTLAVT